MNRVFLIVLIFGLVITIFTTGFFIEKKSIRDRFNFLAFLSTKNVSEEAQSLKTENEILKAQIEKTQIFCSNNGTFSTTAGKNFLSARIFSNYPFNVKNILSINAGIRAGVKKGLAATLGENIFIGQVSEVLENSASVRTVFDPDWQLAVKIGADKINGLFKGGNEPKITLIEKSVKIGDPVFTAVPGVPLDLKIGEISEIRESAGGVFKEAIVKVPYNINQLETVNLLVE